jgi:hypothetical protein
VDSNFFSFANPCKGKTIVKIIYLLVITTGFLAPELLMVMEM